MNTLKKLFGTRDNRIHPGKFVNDPYDEIWYLIKSAVESGGIDSDLTDSLREAYTLGDWHGILRLLQLAYDRYPHIDTGNLLQKLTIELLMNPVKKIDRQYPYDMKNALLSDRLERRYLYHQQSKKHPELSVQDKMDQWHQHKKSKQAWSGGKKKSRHSRQNKRSTR